MCTTTAIIAALSLCGGIPKAPLLKKVPNSVIQQRFNQLCFIAQDYDGVQEAVDTVINNTDLPIHLKLKKNNYTFISKETIFKNAETILKKYNVTLPNNTSTTLAIKSPYTIEPPDKNYGKDTHLFYEIKIDRYINNKSKLQYDARIKTCCIYPYDNPKAKKRIELRVNIQ